MKRKRLLLIISGPSGAGKGELVKKLRKDAPEGFFDYSVSATTRAAREGEKHGVNYYFLTKEEFEQRIAEDGMLEYAQYCGNYYGTPKGEIEKKLNAGVHVILEIEVQGAKNVKQRMPEAVAIMVAPPDFPNLERRLRGRGTNTEEDIQNRLKRAESELAQLPNYDYLVINYDGMLDKAVQDVFDIIKVEQDSVKRNSGFVAEFYGK